MGQCELKITKHVGSHSSTVLDMKETLRKLVGVQRNMAYSPADVETRLVHPPSGQVAVICREGKEL